MFSVIGKTKQGGLSASGQLLCYTLGVITLLWGQWKDARTDGVVCPYLRCLGDLSLHTQDHS